MKFSVNTVVVERGCGGEPSPSTDEPVLILFTDMAHEMPIKTAKIVIAALFLLIDNKW